MKLLLTILSLSFILTSCTSNKKQSLKEFTFPEIGWKIKVPPDITVMDSALQVKIDETGAKLTKRRLVQ